MENDELDYENTPETVSEAPPAPEAPEPEPTPSEEEKPAPADAQGVSFATNREAIKARYMKDRSTDIPKAERTKK